MASLMLSLILMFHLNFYSPAAKHAAHKQIVTFTHPVNQPQYQQQSPPENAKCCWDNAFSRQHGWTSRSSSTGPSYMLQGGNAI